MYLFGSERRRNKQGLFSLQELFYLPQEAQVPHGHLPSRRPLQRWKPTTVLTPQRNPVSPGEEGAAGGRTEPEGIGIFHSQSGPLAAQEMSKKSNRSGKNNSRRKWYNFSLLWGYLMAPALQLIQGICFWKEAAAHETFMMLYFCHHSCIVSPAG